MKRMRLSTSAAAEILSKAVETLCLRQEHSFRVERCKGLSEGVLSIVVARQERCQTDRLFGRAFACPDVRNSASCGAPRYR